MRRAVGGMVPGIAVAMLGFEASYALRRDQPLKRGEPMPVIGFAGVGIAARLRAFDFLCKRCGPLVPREDAAFMKAQRHRKRLRFPGVAKYRPVIVARNVFHNASVHFPKFVLHSAPTLHELRKVGALANI